MRRRPSYWREQRAGGGGVEGSDLPDNIRQPGGAVDLADARFESND